MFAEELLKFGLLLRPHSAYLVDRCISAVSVEQLEDSSQEPGAGSPVLAAMRNRLQLSVGCRLIFTFDYARFSEREEKRRNGRLLSQVRGQAGSTAYVRLLCATTVLAT